MTATERTRHLHIALARYCTAQGWSSLAEFPLPNGRRADILALAPDATFHIIEIKSCARDFLADSKWPDYRDFCDSFSFAIDPDFPAELVPQEAGLICAAGADDTALLRAPPLHPLSPARRRALLLRYALLAGGRLAAFTDPAGLAGQRAALRLD